MSRVERIAELTGLMSEAEIILLFNALDLSRADAKAYLATLSQYSYWRRKEVLRMAMRLKAEQSASLSPSASASESV